MPTSGNKIKLAADGSGAVLTLRINGIDVKVLSLMADDELRTVPDQALWELRSHIGNWLEENGDRWGDEDTVTVKVSDGTHEVGPVLSAAVTAGTASNAVPVNLTAAQTPKPKPLGDDGGDA